MITLKYIKTASFTTRGVTLEKDSTIELEDTIAEDLFTTFTGMFEKVSKVVTKPEAEKVTEKSTLVNLIEPTPEVVKKVTKK